jgi:Plasmid pRiA4b ORF-3-like protein
MHVYRFRILLEDVDDFVRDIEISSGSTFEDFHKAILETVDLDGKELASFFLTDARWIKKQEITLVDMGEMDAPVRFDEDEDNEKAPLLMSKCKLADYIDDPHQRMIFAYDFLNMYEFYIELSKIIPAEKKVKYPRCIKSEGIIPKAGATISATDSLFEAEEIYVDEGSLSQKDGDEEDDMYADKDADSEEDGGDKFDE